jgi:hypothetical protein
MAKPKSYPKQAPLATSASNYFEEGLLKGTSPTLYLANVIFWRHTAPTRLRIWSNVN